MIQENQIDMARTIIDRLPDQGHQLSPGEQAQALRDIAEDTSYKSRLDDLELMARHLDQSRLQAMASEYKIQDQRSIEHQKIFFHKSKRAQIHSFLLTFWATGLLATGPLVALVHWVTSHAAFTHDGLAAKLMAPICMIGSLTSGVLAEMEIKQIRAGNFLETFKQARAEAENIRTQFFELISQKLTGGSTFLAALQLEYVRRFLLQSQLEYYQSKSSGNQKKAMSGMSRTGYALAAIVILEGMAGILGLTNANLTVIAGMVLILKAYVDMRNAEEGLQQYKGNAERFEHTRKALNRVWATVDVVRDHVIQGNPQSLEAFTRAVTAPMKTEQEQWNADFELRFAELETLENRIAEGMVKKK